ncbi:MULTISPECIES: GNAT family N-acetyltransferase [unclassified Frankia]
MPDPRDLDDALRSVRPASEDDVDVMRDIERTAGVLFAGIGMTDIAGHSPLSAEKLAEYVAGGRAWVSDAPVGVAVGYALADVLPTDVSEPGPGTDGAPPRVGTPAASVHLEQLSVRPEHGRSGRGRALSLSVIDYARPRRVRRVTLSTFRTVPWNGPLYARWGFRELVAAEMTPALADLVAHESELGLAPNSRMLMAIDLD